MYIGLPNLGLNSIARAMFAPQQLFSAGQQGAYYEAYDPQSLLERTNFATYSSEFDNSTAWARTALLSVTPDADGVGDLLVPTTAATSHYIGANPSPLVAGGSYTVVIRAKAGGYDWLGVAMNVGTSYFNIATGALGSIGGVIGTPTIVPVPDAPGYYDITLVPNGAATLALYVANANAGFSFAGDGVSGIYIARIQVNKGAAVAYQEVTDWNTEYMAAALSRIGMWQDAVGTTPVTAVEQPTGRWMDTRFNMALGSELITVAADRDFSSDTGYWTKAAGVTIGGGVCDFAAVLNNAGITRSLLTLGKVYEVTYTITSYTSGALRLFVGATGTGVSRTAAGTYTERLTCTGDLVFRIYTVGTTTASISNVTIKEVTGNHATQATAAARPTLSARYNVITNSELLTNAAWVKIGTATAPTATTLALPANNDYVYHNVTPAATYNGMSMTVRAELSGVAGTSVRFGLYDNVNSFTNCQEIVLSATPTVVSLTITPGSATDIRVMCGRVSIVGTPASSVTFSKIDVRSTADAALSIPTYQRVNTSTDYDTVDFMHSVDFLGTDDSIVSASGGGGTAGFLFCAAITVEGGSGTARTLWSDTGTNTGYRVRITASDQLELAAGDGVGYTANNTADTLEVGGTYVVTAWDDGTNLNVQIDKGTIESTARPAVSAGTSAFTLGKDNGAASSFFIGRMYAAVYRTTDAGDATRAQLQTYIAAKAGMTL